MVESCFGTDGIRGRVGDGLITPEFALKLGWAAGEFLKHKYPDNKRIYVVIAKDTRLSGYLFEYAIASGLTAAGVNVYLLGPMPTPAVAYFTRTFDAELGVVVSASHNAYQDNGIKFFRADGMKLSDEDEVLLSELVDQPLVCASPDKVGRIKRVDDAQGRYIEFCKSSVPPLMSLSDFKVVLDCANGATYHIAPKAFRELGAEVIVIHDSPDGLNINANCGSCYLDSLQDKVLEVNADLGIAFDGDGDRVIMVDHLGKVVDGDKILYLLAKDRQERGVLEGGAIGTVMTNMAIENAFAKQNIPFERTKVGDRHVMEALKEKNWNIGGESSGHIISLSKTTTGDGIIAALQVLSCLRRINQNLSESLDGIDLFPQKLINISFAGNEEFIRNNKDLWDNIYNKAAEVESELGEKGRVLIRASGTEPVIRVMVEAEDEQLVNKYIDELVERVESLLKIG